MLTRVYDAESIRALGQRSNYTSLNRFPSLLVATSRCSASWDRCGLTSLFNDWPRSTESDQKTTSCFFFVIPMSFCFPRCYSGWHRAKLCNPQTWPLLVLFLMCLSLRKLCVCAYIYMCVYICVCIYAHTRVYMYV